MKKDCSSLRTISEAAQKVRNCQRRCVGLIGPTVDQDKRQRGAERRRYRWWMLSVVVVASYNANGLRAGRTSRVQKPSVSLYQGCFQKENVEVVRHSCR